MAKTILEEAMEDTKLLKETAIENAKNVLVEALSPKIKEFVDSQLGEAPATVGMVPGMPVEAGMYEKHDDAGKDVELLKQLGLLGMDTDSLEDQDNEDEKHESDEDEDDEDMDENTKLQAAGVTEADKKDKEEKEELKEAEEVVEVSEADLKEALSEILGNFKVKTEATVTKGFGDAQNATPKSAGGPGSKGLADEKNGEHMWSDEEAPHSQDWTVKEAAYRKKIENLAKENQTLHGEIVEYKEACNHLKRNLQEVNLFNSKLLYTNKLLHSAKLNNEQRLSVVEAFDRAQSLREVELVYKSLSESLKIAGVLGESKLQKTFKGPKASRLTLPSSTVLQESAKRDEKDDDFSSRMQQLAGLVG